MTTFQGQRHEKSRFKRVTILAGVLFLGFGLVELRLIWLQVFRHEELEAKAEAYRFKTRIDQSWRGQIRDRNGIPLALTVPVKNVYADLKVWTNRVDELAAIVAPLLGTNQAGLASRVNQSLARRDGADSEVGPGALLLKRGVGPAEWTSVKEALARETFGMNTNKLSSRKRTLLKSLRRWTLFAVDDQRRYYPHGESLAHVLGFVGSGTNGHLLQGKWGLEAFLDWLLAGQNGIRISSQDAAGNELPFCRTTNSPARDGVHVVLTIDLTLQKIVEKALANVVTRYHPSNASCVIVHPATGEVLAMATWPAYCPQQPGVSLPAAWRNHVISDRNEVGSVFKVITLATALELGVVNLEQRIYCENGRWVYKGMPLHDDSHRYGFLSVRECLAKSSNIGLAKIALLVGTNRLYDFITRFGFTRSTGLPLPYETAGLVHHPTNWWANSITRLAIGHELAVSQMQLAMAYAAIANDGKLMHPMLVKQLNHADGRLWGRYEPGFVRSVVRPETARQVREAMRDAVEHGTGKLAALPQHSCLGKTGTAQKSNGRQILHGHVYCSFVGMVPAEKPELVIAVAVDDPANGAYGGTVAAPVFREIAEQAVALYNIPADKGLKSTKQTFLSRNVNSNRNLVARVR
jgi:cell division protein FtsI/penicillin-binding protein 2